MYIITVVITISAPIIISWGLAREVKTELAHTKDLESRVKREMLREALRIPNWIHPDTPEGPESEARVLREIGVQREFSFTPRTHVELGRALDWFDFESSSASSGPRFSYLRNEAVFLEMALMQWSLKELCNRGFTAVAPPVMVHPHIVERCGFIPRGTSSSVYQIANSSLCLTGTSEVPLAATLLDRIVDETALPIQMVGVSPCYRTEAGAGAAVPGIYRQHQFNKVEMFVASDPEDSEAVHQQLFQIQTEICEALGLHARALDMPTEELGASAYRKFDVEAWMPGRGKDFYGEVNTVLFACVCMCVCVSEFSSFDSSPVCRS